MDLMSLIDPAKVLQVVVALIAINGFLMGVHGFLNWIKDKTSTDIDNKAAAAVGKVIEGIQKLLDLVQKRSSFDVNPAPKPANEAGYSKMPVLIFVILAALGVALIVHFS